MNDQVNLYKNGSGRYQAITNQTSPDNRPAIEFASWPSIRAAKAALKKSEYEVCQVEK